MTKGKMLVRLALTSIGGGADDRLGPARFD
jgi:hypothetical protein